MKNLIKALLLGPLCGLFLYGPALAQSTKAQINTAITTTFPDNTVGAITPTGLRSVTSSIVNSIMPTAPVVAGNLACFNGTTGLLQDCGLSPSGILTVGTSTITGGTTTAPLLNNGGVLGNGLISSTWSTFLQTGTGAASRTVQSKLQDTVNARDFGAICDGVTNDAVALQAAINAAAGKALFMPQATCLTNSTLTLPANTTITGAGREASILKSTANPALSATNVSNISLNNFHIMGTNSVTSWAASSIGPVAIIQNGSSVATGSNYNIQFMKFSGFNTSYWVYFAAVGSPNLFTNITFANNFILTDAASVPTDATPSNNTNYAFVVFSGSAGSGRVENTLVYNNRLEATGVCFGLTLFSNTYKSMISNNLILNPGNTNNAHCIDGTGTVFNSYGILLYDVNADGNPPTNFSVIGNTVILPVAAGIYLAGDGNAAHNTAIYNSSHSLVANNLVDGQSSTDELLPRGGISINALTDIHVIGNKLFNGYGGINAVDQRTGSLFIIGNDCTTNVGGNGGLVHPFCIHLSSGANGSSNTSKIVVKDNYLETPSTLTSVIRLESVTGRRFLDVEISGNSIRGNYNGLLAQNQFFSGLFTVAENKFSGANTNIMFSASGLTGTLSLMDNVFYNSTSGVSGITFATLPAALNGSRVYVSDGLAGSGPCTGASTGSSAMRQNGAWKCF